LTNCNYTYKNLWARFQADIQQKGVAVILDISKQRYSELENNNDRPHIRTIEILNALNYTEETARKFLDAIPQ
jgi:transcriptional regulator with XRE-family HTH domain